MSQMGQRRPLDNIRGMSGLRTTSGPSRGAAVGLRSANCGQMRRSKGASQPGLWRRSDPLNFRSGDLQNRAQSSQAENSISLDVHCITSCAAASPLRGRGQ